MSRKDCRFRGYHKATLCILRSDRVDWALSIVTPGKAHRGNDINMLFRSDETDLSLMKIAGESVSQVTEMTTTVELKKARWGEVHSGFVVDPKRSALTL